MTNNICDFYNTSYLCSYHTDEIFGNHTMINEIMNDDDDCLETVDQIDISQLTDYDKEFISDAVYRQEFLNILSLEEYDEQLVNERIEILYDLVKDYEPFKCCIQKARDSFIFADDFVGMMILFSYYNMHLTHLCISDFIKNGTMSHENLENLKKELYKK